MSLTCPPATVSPSLIDEIAREGTGRMPPEVHAYIAQFTDQRDEDGRRRRARFERGRLVERSEGAAT
ncbi:hypothetical protein BS35_000643 [Actinomadura glauciflava]|nr:hypothetical protein [Actinomadura glauciflava]